MLKKAEEIKEKGNELFRNNKLIEAAAKFSEAIELGVETNLNAIFYSNRALINIQLENYGNALSGINLIIKIQQKLLV